MQIVSLISNGLMFIVLQGAVTPAIRSVMPSEVVSDTTSASVKITGSNFDSQATVQYDEATISVTYVDSTTFTTTLGVSQLRSGVHSFRVVNPGPTPSNAASFLVDYPIPAISSLTPTVAPAGTQVSVSIGGSGFVPSSKVLMNGIQLASTYVSSTSMTATASSSTTGPQAFNVSNPSPGGGLTNTVTIDFEVTNVVNPVNPCGVMVSGAVTVLADATDDVGVVGVQFKLDGANFGPELTAAPYSMTWNTTTATNGCHVLAAVARDAAGNQGTSSLTASVNHP